MILEMTPLSLAEAKDLVVDLDEKKDLKDYFKKFGKLNNEKSENLSKEIENLGNLKIKKENIVKIIDFLPKDAEDLNKIFNEVTLDEKETKEILEIVGKY